MIKWKYGFVDRNGKFYHVQSLHEKFARLYVTEHGLQDEYSKWADCLWKSYCEFLVYVKGWVLLHNPNGGKPVINTNGRRITKKQVDFLMHYHGSDDWLEFAY